MVQEYLCLYVEQGNRVRFQVQIIIKRLSTYMNTQTADEKLRDTGPMDV